MQKTVVGGQYYVEVDTYFRKGKNAQKGERFKLKICQSKYKYLDPNT